MPIIGLREFSSPRSRPRHRPRCRSCNGFARRQLSSQQRLPRVPQRAGVVEVGELVISKPLLLWVNDLWMAVFFFLVGLEIKREVLVGQLSSRSELLLPASTAVGGMVVPAAIYAALN
jgi:Na+/H+ antiporter NhaA